jgi:Raf kinase inhibitor-like YbhB/YbcL family protein
MPYDPYALAFPTAAFSVTSKDFADGGPLPQTALNTAEGANESPGLSWGPLPAGTESLVVTGFDADAPIPGGLWHWIVKDIPATVGGLAPGAASALPAGAVHLPNDLGYAGYSGANPPPGTGTHRMFICVTALDIKALPVPDSTSLAMLHILMIPHTLGRATIVGTSHAPAAS